MRDGRIDGVAEWRGEGKGWNHGSTGYLLSDIKPLATKCNRDRKRRREERGKGPV